jgi:hypothetical protein
MYQNTLKQLRCFFIRNNESLNILRVMKNLKLQIITENKVNLVILRSHKS